MATRGDAVTATANAAAKRLSLYNACVGCRTSAIVREQVFIGVTGRRHQQHEQLRRLHSAPLVVSRLHNPSPNDPLQWARTYRSDDRLYPSFSRRWFQKEDEKNSKINNMEGKKGTLVDEEYQSSSPSTMDRIQRGMKKYWEDSTSSFRSLSSSKTFQSSTKNETMESVQKKWNDTSQKASLQESKESVKESLDKSKQWIEQTSTRIQNDSSSSSSSRLERVAWKLASVTKNAVLWSLHKVSTPVQRLVHGMSEKSKQALRKAALQGKERSKALLVATKHALQERSHRIVSTYLVTPLRSTAELVQERVRSIVPNISTDKVVNSLWWWSLAAIAVYGIATTVPKEMVRLALAGNGNSGSSNSKNLLKENEQKDGD